MTGVWSGIAGLVGVLTGCGGPEGGIRLPEAAVAACASLDEGRVSCLVHFAARLRTSDTSATPLALSGVVERARALPEGELPAGLQEEWGLANWMDALQGRGYAPLAELRALPDDQAPLARTALAWELARWTATLPQERRVETVLAVWRSERDSLTAPALEPDCRPGRVDRGASGGAAEVWPQTPRPSGRGRVLAEDPEIDLALAALEAVYAEGSSTAAAFVQGLTARDAGLRNTAARLVALTQPDLGQALAEQPDPVIRTGAQRGLAAAVVPWSWNGGPGGSTVCVSGE